MLANWSKLLSPYSTMNQLQEKTLSLALKIPPETLPSLTWETSHIFQIANTLL